MEGSPFLSGCLLGLISEQLQLLCFVRKLFKLILVFVKLLIGSQWIRHDFWYPDFHVIAFLFVF